MARTGLCPERTCRRPYVLTADGKVRFHNVDGKRTTPECPGSGELPGPWSPDDEPLTGTGPTREDEVRAAAYREAADVIDSDDTCDCGGCDTCTLRAAAARLRDRADQIAPATAPIEEPDR